MGDISFADFMVFCQLDVSSYGNIVVYYQVKDCASLDIALTLYGRRK